MYADLKPALLLAPVLFGLLTGDVRGQELRGILVDKSTAQPVSYAAVYVLEGERVHARRMADANGVFSAELGSGRVYRLRVEQLGYEPFVSDLIRAEAVAGSTIRFEIEARPITLPSLTVSTTGRGCTISEGGPVIQALWNEARKALTASRLTDDQRLLQYEGARYVRRLHSDRRRVVSHETRPLSGRSQQPFRSADPQVLSDCGYMHKVPGSAEYEFLAPDAGVLLSSQFLNDHCFSLARRAEKDSEVGLRFQPVGGRTSKLVDIAGTFWLSSTGFRLQRIEFQYEGNVDGQSLEGSQGVVEFTAGPSGAWLVSRWWVRIPLLEISRVSHFGSSESRARVAGFHEEGGHIERFATSDAQWNVYAPGALAGIVYDSIRAMPLSGAIVQLNATNHKAVTGTDGRFRLDGIYPGTYAIRFVHPRLDSVPAITQLAFEGVVRERQESRITLAIPSLATLRNGACPSGSGISGTIVFGQVKRASDGAPVAHATIRVERDSLFVRERVGRATLTTDLAADASGRFVVCDVPPGAVLTIQAFSDSLRSDVNRLTVRNPEHQHDLLLDRVARPTRLSPTAINIAALEVNARRAPQPARFSVSGLAMLQLRERGALVSQVARSFGLSVREGTFRTRDGRLLTATDATAAFGLGAGTENGALVLTSRNR